ncbi:MAG: hypothetical protein WKG01_06945 [Kofleriaceae bacterium]
MATTRVTSALAATTIVAVASTIWLYFDNRTLRADLQHTAAAVAAEPAVEPGSAADPWTAAVKKERDARVAISAGDVPALPAAPKESRLDRRARRTMEFGERFGRLEGETEDEYRARIVPLIKAGLAVPRERALEMRKLAEEKAKVTPAQSAQLDKAFEKVYADVLDYTNKAITDGQLSPYERNVAGWLDYAGGLGGMLTDAQGQVGKVLDAGQIKAMYDSGFEWGEYLGLNAPWERIQPPPPRK